jgi:hypothetical protein
MMSYKVTKLLVRPMVLWRTLLLGVACFGSKSNFEIFELITSQEDASNQLSVGMSIFVERTSTMKKVCIPL